MVGKLIRIAIALLIVHGAARVGLAYWTFYQFEDRLTEIAQFGDQKTEPQLCAQALEAAALLNVPVEGDAINLLRGVNPPFNCREGYKAAARTAATGPQKMAFQASYTQNVLLLPGYTRRFTFKPSVEVWARVF